MLRFSSFEFDGDSGRLRRDGEEISLSPQSAGVLAALLQKPGSVVSREDLKETLWTDDTIVDFDAGLNFVVSQLRRALDDDPRAPRFIETLPRRGYRFIGEFEASRRERYRKRLRLGILTALLLAALGVYFTPDPEPELYVMPGHTLAVLPIRTEDSELKSVAGGLSTELRAQLGELASPRLRLLGGITTRAALDSNWTLPRWQEELDVDYFLDTSLRQADGRLRITMELVEMESGNMVWASSFHHTAKEILSVQRTVTIRIASVVSRNADLVMEGNPVDRWEETPSAESYLRALDLEQAGGGASLAASHAEFERLVEMVATDPRAWAGLGRTAHLLSMYGLLERDVATSKLAEAVQRCMSLAPDSPATLSIKGTYELWYAWDVDAAKRSLTRAIEARPNDAFLRHEYAWALLAGGDLAEGTKQIELAAFIEPLSTQARMDVGWMMLRLGHYEAAIEAAERTLAIQPRHSGALFCLARAHWILGDYVRSADATRALLTTGSEAARLLADEVTGESPQQICESYLRWLRTQWEDESPGSQAYGIASIHQLLGDSDGAILWLERSLERRSLSMLTLHLDPVFEELHGDARFDAILHAVIGS